MTTLTVVPATRDGLDLTVTAQAASLAGDEFANDGQVVVVFTNTSGAPKTVTFVTQAELDSNPVNDKQVVVPAASTMAIGGWPAGIYNDDDGMVRMTYSDVTDL